MPGFSAKNKIIMLIVVWLVASILMLTYFFKFFDESNQQILASMAKQKKDMAVLQAQQQSEVQAQRDLQELSQKPIQPEDFFTSDVALVNELKTLETLGQRFNVKMQISGVSGTVKTASKAKTVTQLVVIPYNISINGSLVQVVNTIETLENLSFITNINNVSIGSADLGNVSAGMTANFYLRK